MSFEERLKQKAKTSSNIHTDIQMRLIKPIEEYTDEDEEKLKEEWVPKDDVLALVKEEKQKRDIQEEKAINDAIIEERKAYFIEKQKLQQIIELLKEVAEKRGAYSQDQLTHAENVIENASIRAKKAIEILEEALK